MRRRARMSDTPPKNSCFNPTSSLAYAILASTSAWSLYALKDRECRPFSIGMLSLMTCHALLGVVRYGHPDSGKTIKRIFDNATMVVQYAVLPLTNIDIYLSTKMAREIAYLHVITVAVPAATCFLNDKVNNAMIDVSAMINIASCLYLGYFDDNPWAIGLAAVAAMNHFIYSRIASHVSAPKQDLLAIGLSFFDLFAVQALNFASYHSTPAAIKAPKVQK